MDIKRVKDIMLSKAARAMINTKIKSFAVLLTLYIDSSKKYIFIQVLPYGEKSPIVVYIDRYRLLRDKDVDYIRIEKVKSSRVWIENLLCSYIVGKNFRVPAILRVLL
jgi:hypothetical protein